MPTPRKYANSAERQAEYRARCSLRKGMKPEVEGQQPLLRIPQALGERRWNAMLGQARSLMESVTDEMESYYEEKSERWQESERGERFTERMESIAEVTDLLRDLP